LSLGAGAAMGVAIGSALNNIALGIAISAGLAFLVNRRR